MSPTGKVHNYCKNCGVYTGTKPAAICTDIRHTQSYARKRERERVTFRNAITLLGGKCACCGFDNVNATVRGQSFLQIDHINGLQGLPRQDGYYLARKLLLGEIRDGFRVLCFPCNIGMNPGESVCELHKWESLKLSKWVGGVNSVPQLRIEKEQESE